MVLQVDLEVGMEIHRRSGIEATDIGQMAGHVAGGQIEGAAERDRDVGKIAADSKATADDFRGRQVRPAGAGDVTDISLHPVANGDHLINAVDQVAELLGGQREQLIRITITTRKRVANGVGRDFSNRDRKLFEIGIVRQGGNLHQGIVDNHRLTREQGPTMRDIPVSVLILLGRLLGPEGQAFRQDDLITAIGTRTNDQENGRGLNGLVNQTTSDTDSQWRVGSRNGRPVIQFT